MRVACWITEATDTHAEYVILIAYTCIACLLVFCHLAQLFIIFVSFSLCIVNDYNLLLPRNAQFLLVYFTLSGCYMFWLFAIFRELTTK